MAVHLHFSELQDFMLLQEILFLLLDLHSVQALFQYLHDLEEVSLPKLLMWELILLERLKLELDCVYVLISRLNGVYHKREVQTHPTAQS